MKNCTLILMVILTIAACKKEKVDSATIESNVERVTPLLDSIDLAGYYKLKSLREKAEWLRDSGKFVYDSVIKKAVLEDHKVKGNIINQKERYVIKWGKLKGLIGSYGYNTYLDVIYKEDKINDLKRVNKYIPDGDSICYRFSSVLIKNLAKKYAKDDNAEFQFSFANLDQKSFKSLEERVVVIQVIGNTSGENPAPVSENPYYDYSTDPKKKNQAPTPNIPL